MKIALVTGANKGIGFEVVRQLAQNGFFVYIGSRSLESGLAVVEKLKADGLTNIEAIQLDVTNQDSINNARILIGKKTEVLDVLVNNAGISGGFPQSALDATIDQFQTVYDTNVFGVVRVTQAFIPYFRKKGSGLFITTGSSAGLMGFPVSSMYDASKWALEGWSESLSYELSEVGVGIKTIEPGLVATEIGDRSVIVSHPAYETLMGKFMAAIEYGENVTTAEQIAEVVYEAATDGKTQIRYTAGEDAKMLMDSRKQLDDATFMEGIKTQSGFN